MQTPHQLLSCSLRKTQIFFSIKKNPNHLLNQKTLIFFSINLDQAPSMAATHQTTSRKVAILGAGVSGLAAAKQLSHLNPVIFEATDSIGGVWRHCSYSSTKLQSLRCDYEFSDFSWPDRDNSSFPSHTEILTYLSSYAERFDLMKKVVFNAKVVELRFVGDRNTSDSLAEYGSLLPGKPSWEVAVRRNESEFVEWYTFEFVVVCIGKYGDVPKMPMFPVNKDPEMFDGKVLHAIDYCKLDKEAATELLKGKKVVVVGFKKSGIDLAMECAEANQGAEGKPCTMILRTLHWTVPHYWIWGLPFSFFFSTRFSQFLHETPNQGFLRSSLCSLLSPLKKAVSKFVESYLVWKMPLEKYGLKPEHPFVEDYASCQMAIMPENFFVEAEKGKIVFSRPSKWWFWNGGVEYEDGGRVEADVVVFATGYDGKKKLKDVLPEPFRSLMDFPSGIMPLYRGTIHPLIPNMAFMGYIESVSNLHSSELRSKWLSRLLDDKFKLPSVEAMLDQTVKEAEVMKRSTRFYKRHCVSTFSINHDDQICEEMGWTSWRKNNLLAEVFSPYSSQDYEDGAKAKKTN